MDEAKSSLPWKRFVAEGVAIVASILIALAFDAAWESRADRRAEVEELARLSGEFRTNISELQRRLLGQRSLLEHQDTLSIMLRSGPRDEPITIPNRFLITVLFGPVPEPETAVMDALIGSGRLSLITDPEVREGLARVSARFSDLELLQEMRAREHYMDHVLPYLTQIADLHSLLEARRVGPERSRERSVYPWTSVEGQTTLPNTIRLQNLVSQQRLWTGVALGSFEETLGILQEVADLLGS